MGVLWLSILVSMYLGRYPAIASCSHKTTSGKCCSIPFTYKGVTYNSCTTADHNKPWCSLDPVYKGNWGDCAAGSCSPKTTSGKCCIIPFTYKGVTYNSCTTADHNKPWCSLDRVYKGNWGDCAARSCSPKTTSGKCCIIPFTYKGVTYNSCTTADHNKPWCSLDPVYKGNWGDCAAVSCSPKTTSGKCCIIPFTYKGVTYNSCTTADHNKPWCSLDRVYKGNWGDCAAGSCSPKTTSGKCCIIPFTYKGVTYNSCTTADHNKPWCSLDPVYKGNWGDCAARSCSPKTTSGKCCIIPFTYKGVTYNSCTTADHNKPWCSLDPVYKGNWGDCAARSCSPKTTSGKCCIIPFTYKGVTYNSCTTADHNKPWCSLDRVYKGNWGDCV